MDVPQRKVSRYRSQRNAQTQCEEQIPEMPAVPQEEEEKDSGVTRSRSRYHRKNAADPGRTTVTGSKEMLNMDRKDSPRTHVKGSPPRSHSRPATASRSQRQRHGPADCKPETSSDSPPVGFGASKDTEADVDADGYGPPKPAPEVITDRSTKRHDAEQHALNDNPMPKTSLTGDLGPPSRPQPVKSAYRPVLLDGPPSSDKIRATKSMSQLPKYDIDEDERGGGCFGLFKRKRPEPPFTPNEKSPLTRAPEDVPKSAVNSGVRRVLVECGKSKTVFPVTVETTPIDIIKSAATVMSERINPRSAVLLEMFGSVGIQRPLRRYEHIRDVMNSWDTDRQNTLLLVDPGTGTSEAELSLSGVPKQAPGDVSWLLSISQKPGKWDKRVVTLNTYGQISVQRDSSKPQQVDNICHLSDFDIYTPTLEKIRKKIKPPKKHCFAIKSQQKAIMFESTQNFVHFFCTNDARTADEFYAAVQGWRSWYLHNKLGEGKKKIPDTDIKAAPAMTSNHRPGDSIGSHYQLGSFKPLMDEDAFDQRPSTAKSTSAQPSSSGGFVKPPNQNDPIVLPERRTSTKKKQHSSGSLGNKILADDEPLANLAKRGSIDQKRTSMDASRQNDFAPSGLLGRSYSQRQRDAAEKENQRRQDAFVAGPNLLNSGYDGNREEERTRQRPLDDTPQRGKSVKVTSHNSSSDVRRNKSTRQDGVGRSGSVREKVPPKPLVDLTPQYKEPPQHANKGKGYHPDQVGPGGLVANATSPEDFIGAPPSTDWRGRNGQNASPAAQPLLLQPQSSGGHRRTNSVNKQGGRPTTSRSPHKDEGSKPFTGEGLLAGNHAQSGWGGGDRGRGVMDGTRARGPMVDLNESSKFAQGSLLNKVEREHARQGPIIDREKRDE